MPWARRFSFIVSRLQKRDRAGNARLFPIARQTGQSPHRRCTSNDYISTAPESDLPCPPVNATRGAACPLTTDVYAIFRRRRRSAKPSERMGTPVLPLSPRWAYESTVRRGSSSRNRLDSVRLCPYSRRMKSPASGTDRPPVLRYPYPHPERELRLRLEGHSGSFPAAGGYLPRLRHASSRLLVPSMEGGRAFTPVSRRRRVFGPAFTLVLTHASSRLLVPSMEVGRAFTPVSRRRRVFGPAFTPGWARGAKVALADPC